jgi:hypothetical protein
MAFKMAGIFAFKEAMKDAKPILLEPIMKVEVVTPEEYQGDIMGDLNRRRGQIQGMDTKNGLCNIDARVPLAEMFGYSTDVRSLSKGRASYSMEPANYEQVPAQILKQVVADRDASPLMDQRQQLIDKIAEIVPLRQIDRDTGQIALISTGGAVLLDGRPALFGFTPVGKVTPDMTLASGALSGLTMNGRPVTFGDGSGKLDGGAMAANFRLRDIEAPVQQVRLDALARDLIARFANPSVDTTLTSGAPGLFTDAGAAFNAATETGLAGRLAVNAAADPANGGALWRLRDGLGATADAVADMIDRFETLPDAAEILSLLGASA